MTRIPDAQDLPAMLAAFGVAVKVGTTTVDGIVDEAGADLLGAGGEPGITSNRVTVIVRTGSLPGLATGVAIVVDGETMVVRDHGKLDDGALTRIDCVKDA